MHSVWAQRRKEVLRDCLVSPDVFTQMVERLGEFVVPSVRRDSSLHIATQVDWNSKECSHIPSDLVVRDLYPARCP